MRRRIFAAVPAVLLLLTLLILFPMGKGTVDTTFEPKVSSPPLTKTDILVDAFDDFLQTELDSAGTVGAAIAIVYKGELIYRKCYGYREEGKSDPVDSLTLFRLASVSKTVSGVLSGMLDYEGLVPLDNKVRDYLPTFKLKDTLNTMDLSIRHLLSHTSGLVPHAYDNLVEASVPMKVIIDSLRRVNIAAPPGEVYGYQNVIFSVYDTICQLATGSDFQDLLKEKLFQPYSMFTASADFLSFENNSNIAIPHVRTAAGYTPVRLNKGYYTTAPAAGINASISDMIAFLSGISRTLKEPDAEKILGEVFKAQVYSPLRWHYLRNWKEVDSRHYGLGWRIIGTHGTTVAYHGGYVRGYRAEIAYCPDEDFGICFLSNSPGRIGSRIVPEFLERYFELFTNDASEEDLCLNMP